MSYPLVFVGGIHGVGKSRICTALAQQLGVETITASTLIRQVRQQPTDAAKRVGDMAGNQDALCQALASYRPLSGALILDGHCCLLDAQQQVIEVPLTTFSTMAPRAMVLIHDTIPAIQQRLNARDGLAFDATVLDTFQHAELRHANAICAALAIPLLRVTPSDDRRPIEAFVTTYLRAL